MMFCQKALESKLEDEGIKKIELIFGGDGECQTLISALETPIPRQRSASRGGPGFGGISSNPGYSPAGAENRGHRARQEPFTAPSWPTDTPAFHRSGRFLGKIATRCGFDPKNAAG